MPSSVKVENVVVGKSYQTTMLMLGVLVSKRIVNKYTDFSIYSMEFSNLPFVVSMNGDELIDQI